MSRTYQVKVSESLRKHIKVTDGVQTVIPLLKVLPEGRMADLLAAELEAAGFERRADGALVRTEEDGTVVHVDPATARVTVAAALDAEFEESLELQGAVEDIHMLRGTTALKQTAKSRLEGKATEREAALRGELADTLSERLRDLHGELDGVANRTMAAALKERAAELGEVKEIHEDPETGSLTIRVKV